MRLDMTCERGRRRKRLPIAWSFPIAWLHVNENRSRFQPAKPPRPHPPAL